MLWIETVHTDKDGPVKLEKILRQHRDCKVGVELSSNVPIEDMIGYINRVRERLRTTNFTVGMGSVREEMEAVKQFLSTIHGYEILVPYELREEQNFTLVGIDAPTQRDIRDLNPEEGTQRLILTAFDYVNRLSIWNYGDPIERLQVTVRAHCESGERERELIQKAFWKPYLQFLIDDPMRDVLRDLFISWEIASQNPNIVITGAGHGYHHGIDGTAYSMLAQDIPIPRILVPEYQG